LDAEADGEVILNVEGRSGVADDDRLGGECAGPSAASGRFDGDGEAYFDAFVLSLRGVPFRMMIAALAL